MFLKRIFKSFISVAVLALIATGCNKDDIIEPDMPPSVEGDAAYALTVFEWMPAPGQFINIPSGNQPWNAVSTQTQANAWAQRRLAERDFVSLGAFGGYVVVGFDHKVANTGGYDIGILGNAFTSAAGGSNEPGVVYVMKDDNGNGLPDDIWYELAGSETLSPNAVRDYSVTYFRPDDYSPVKWIDSFGEEGEVPYLSMFHSQPSYYPFWIKSASYTLTGTLIMNAERTTPLPWGYADNLGEDSLSTEGIGNCNRFRISDAIDAEGHKVDLPYINFVKVQTAVNRADTPLGEISTEVFGIIDLSLNPF